MLVLTLFLARKVAEAVVFALGIGRGTVIEGCEIRSASSRRIACGRPTVTAQTLSIGCHTATEEKNERGCKLQWPREVEYKVERLVEVPDPWQLVPI